MADFSNYELGMNVHELADGLLPEMAAATGFNLAPEPSVENLEAFIKHIGPVKTLQDNISLAQERLGRTDNAVTIAADWVDRSGVLEPAHRNFADTGVIMPRTFDNAFITGGVARWMLRRTEHLEELVASGIRIGRVDLPLGQKQMGEGEHDFVKEYAATNGNLPTQVQFGVAYLVPRFMNAGLTVELLASDSEDGDTIMQEYAETADYIDGLVLAVGNAPSAIQTAGQFRVAAREYNSGFDTDARQLFVSSDTISVAREGEPPATHQNPYSALGQIVRNALFLQKNAQ